MKVKVNAVIDGTTREVEVELPDDQYMTTEQHKTRLASTVQQRLNRQAAGIRKELIGDEEFVGEVLKAKGIDPKTLKPGTTGKEGEAELVARIQNEIREREVNPLKKQLDEVSGSLNNTRRDQLISELTTEMVAAGVKQGVAKRLAEVEVNRGVFAYDGEQQKGWAVKDGEGFAFAPNASKDRPFKGAKEYAADFVANKENADFVDRQKQNGPDLNNRNTNNAGTVRSRAEFKSEKEKSDFISTNGFAAFQALPEK